MKELLVKSVSKKAVLEIVSQISNQKDEVDSLLEIALFDKYPSNMKAAWVYRHLSERDNSYAIADYQKILKQLPNMKPDGVVRDLLRSFLNIPLPEENLGKLADLCMNWLASFDADTAVKYNSMHLLESICKKWPELSDEFLSVLKAQKNKNTKAFDRYSLKFIERVEALR